MEVVTEEGGVSIVDTIVVGVIMEDDVVTDSGDVAGSPFPLKYDSKERLCRFRRVAENLFRSLLGKDVIDVEEGSGCFSFAGRISSVRTVFGEIPSCCFRFRSSNKGLPSRLRSKARRLAFARPVRPSSPAITGKTFSFDSTSTLLS
jgi:hypothetical protein